MKKQTNINLDERWLAVTDNLIKNSKRDLNKVTNIKAAQERVVGVQLPARRHYSKLLEDILSETMKKYEDLSREIERGIYMKNQNVPASETEKSPKPLTSIAKELDENDIHADKVADKKLLNEASMVPFDLPDTDNETDNSLEQSLVVTLDYIQTCDATTEGTTENPTSLDSAEKTGSDHDSRIIAEMDPALHDDDVASP